MSVSVPAPQDSDRPASMPEQEPMAAQEPKPEIESGPPGDPGLFGPGSITWRVHADPLMSVAGIRALLLQSLHPVALAGVMQNSSFREDPWGRLLRTAEYVGTVTYGPTLEARRASARVRGIHRRVVGTDEVTGRSFRATDPDLLLWVHCCEVESFVTTAVRGGLKLSAADVDTYYAEQVQTAALIGIPAGEVPTTAAEMADYFQRTRPELTVGVEARRVARFIMAPPMPRRVRYLTPAQPAWFGLGALGFSLLPRWARRLYRLPGLPTTDFSAVAVSRGLRLTALALPASLREGPHLKGARSRMGLPVGGPL